jgi:multicomponent Na+:H+ antiporter subunit B
MKWIGLIAVVLTGSLLLSGVDDFADFGDPKGPAHAGVGGFSVSRYYITETARDTGVPNLVTAVLGDYRGYDTMFETVVIFAAGIAIFAILRTFGDGPPDRRRILLDPAVDGDHQRIIVGTTARLTIPVIQIFALYVVAHGHHSPGGGFQGGVMLGASFILVALSRDLGSALRRFSERRFLAIACAGVLIYAGFGLLCMALERNFLDYSILHRILPATDPVMARSHGILGVEIGVAFTVTAIMFAIYANLSSKGRLDEGL